MHTWEKSSRIDDNLFLRNILDRVFRVNPAFELIEHGKLSPDQQHSLEGLAQDPEHFGLLLSRDVPELGVLVVNHDSALLFSGLQQPGHLPDHICDPIEVAGLVLDGILEVEWNGRYVTGPAVCSWLFTESFQEIDAVGQISHLSFTALKSVQELPVEDPRAVSSWLYNYNRLPMSPAWARRFASPERINDALGLQPGGPAQVLLDDHFVPSEVPGWRAWQSLNSELTVDLDQPTFKLYISLHPSALPEAFPIVVRSLAEAGVPSFKLGRDAFGLLRPDKLIAYFADYDTLEALATTLAESLAGCPAHGVPFSAALTDDGLLSWGMDPPQSDQIPGWRGVESWRVWVTNRLARTIIRAKALGDGCMEPWHFALLRLRFDGVEPQTWLPSRSMWTD